MHRPWRGRRDLTSCPNSDLNVGGWLSGSYAHLPVCMPSVVTCDATVCARSRGSQAGRETTVYSGVGTLLGRGHCCATDIAVLACASCGGIGASVGSRFSWRVATTELLRTAKVRPTAAGHRP